ncbi:MAG: ATP-binding cassette domain-containing protein [Desulfobacter sp.]|nr:MAG: ATP-binding cassette domain-containing protein [Desulfobacter sp.]
MTDRIKIQIRSLEFHYRKMPVLEDISLDIPDRAVTSVTGPSGQGKSTFLICLNRLWQEIEGARAKGSVCIDFGQGFEEINRPDYPLSLLRRRVGMVFQTPNPLPMSIYNNMAFPLKLVREKDRERIARKVETALRQAFLWDEVKDRLNEDARLLSGGQQQRLCIARALVLAPQVLLLDEPTSSLDPASVAVIEELLVSLKQDRSIILVSHYADQVKRIADHELAMSGRALVPV